MKRCIIFLFISFLCFVSVKQTYAQNKILFRFNADYDLSSDLNSPVNLNHINFVENQIDEDETARTSDGWNYDAPVVANFSHDSSSIITQSPVSFSSSGTIKISGEIYFRTFEENGFLFEWDDSTKSHGFQFYIKNGKLVYEAKINKQKYTAQSAQQIPLNKWIRLNWILKLESSNLILQSYFNSEPALNESFNLSQSAGLIILSNYVKLGIPGYSYADIPALSGEVFAANIKNYIPDPVYIESKVPYDGTGYLGLAYFHDYAVGSTEENTDLRITQNNTPVDVTVFVPYVNDDFVAQGLTNSYEDENYTSDSGYVYIAMYNLDINGQTRLKNSIIVELDPQDEYKIRRCFRLRGTLGASHVGGIAFYKNSIYVSSGKSIERYILPDYTEAQKYIDLFRETGNYWSVQSQASFTNYYNDTLWVGDYVAGSENKIPYLYGYPLNSNGDVINNATPTVYRLPKQAQGVAWRKTNGKEYLFISSSTGSATSSIFKVSRNKLSKSSEAEPDTTFKIPSGAEDISFDRNGNLLNVSESSAKYYQKRETNPWSTYYPFFFIINNEHLFPGGTVGIVDEKISLPGQYELKAYPNPFNGNVNLNYYLKSPANARIVIYNILGKEIFSTDNKFDSGGWHKYSWEPNFISSGTYIASLHVDGRIVNSNKIVYLK